MPDDLHDVTVYKQDHEGREVWHYPGKILDRGETFIKLEARFNRDDSDAGYVVFRRNDRFIEWFYSDRWYSIFEIHDVDNDQLKGWYCNISRPAIFTDGSIRADDLALDLWVSAAGGMQVLDEDEFTNLPISAVDHSAALQAIDALQAQVEARQPPFDAICV